MLGNSPVNRTIADWNRLPEGAIGTSHFKTHVFRKRVREVYQWGEVKVGCMVGIATSYRLDGPRSIYRYFQFLIRSVFLCITYSFMCYYYYYYYYYYYFAFCTFCIYVTHSVFCTNYCSVLFIVYATLPPGTGPIAVSNKYNNILYIQLNHQHLVPVALKWKLLFQVEKIVNRQAVHFRFPGSVFVRLVDV
jgi:hypothetical protein